MEIRDIKLELNYERHEIEEKIIRLNKFMKSEEFNELNDANKVGVREQIKAMKNYFNALTTRIQNLY